MLNMETTVVKMKVTLYVLLQIIIITFIHIMNLVF